MNNASSRESTEKIRKLVEGVRQLPSAPASASRIISIATQDAPDFQELVSAVEQDPAVSMRVLRLANTAGFNRSERVEDIRQAAMLLGTDSLCSAALCVCVRDGLFGAFDSGDPFVRQYWRHSLACACASRMLAGYLDPRRSGAAFAAGLLHDCGRLALLSAVPDAYGQVMADDFLTGFRLVRREQEILGADHCLAGKWLLERWGLPEPFVEAAWTHHQPLGALLGQGGQVSPGLIVAMADRLSHEAMGVAPGASRDASLTGAAEALGLDAPVVFEAVLSGLGAEFAARASLFDLREDAAGFYYNALSRANSRLSDANFRLEDKSRGLERDVKALKRVALAVVDLVASATPDAVLHTLARQLRDGFGSPEGAAFLADPAALTAEGCFWSAATGLRPFSIRLRGDLSPEPGVEGGIPPGLAAHLSGCRMRASALAGAEGPPVHFMDGIGMVSIVEGGSVFGELLFRPPSGTITPEERTAMGLLAQLSAQVFRNLELAGRCEKRSERLAQMMRSMQEMNDKLLKTQRLAAVGQLAAGAAHEINNPLAIISARAQLLEMRETDPAKKKGFRQMADQIERISAILSSLMDFARPSPPKVETVNPMEVMDRVLGFLEGNLRMQNIQVVRDYRLPAPDLMADARQLEQVLLNLAINAQHAMEKEGGTLTARVSYQSETDCVSFDVLDTGEGIARENLEKVFDPFFTTKPEGKGTGLGLSTAYGIVQAHKGRITVESEPGRGSAFTVLLPRDMNAKLVPRGTADGKRAARKSILVADDEGHIREILRESLESSGYAVELAGNGAEALELLKRNRYQLLILDIRMPGRDGLSVLREAAGFASPSMPVLVLTGMAGDGELAEAKALGAASCMRKPFQVDALLAEAARLLGRETPG
ncbi:MAG: HDOD domain-containing protein [Thermodesulfobacteriota bacterium]